MGEVADDSDALADVVAVTTLIGCDATCDVIADGDVIIETLV